jgi:internalin A
MTTQPDGRETALKRIATEARERTGFLDLTQLGLTELPEALFGLKRLRRLHLGQTLVLVDGVWEWGLDCDGPRNRFDGLDGLNRLRDLTALSVAGLECDDLDFVAGLTKLDWLDCSGTQVSELGPLAGLPALQRSLAATLRFLSLARWRG